MNGPILEKSRTGYNDFLLKVRKGSMSERISPPSLSPSICSSISMLEIPPSFRRSRKCSHQLVESSSLDDPVDVAD